VTVGNYYDSKDLGRFSEIGKFKPELAEKFFDYYNAATGEDGALSRREKALIALAIAHTKQCPYCIDAYTTRCLETGANPDQMTEAVHVAAAMNAGITMVHGLQMHNAMDTLGA
jgi:alkylhydroperoxidase/carboxymuconolactone decarboxylase family protein